MMEELKDALADSWEQFRSLPYWGQRAIFGAAFALVLTTIFNWRVMGPLGLLACGVVCYLRFSRGKGSL